MTEPISRDDLTSALQDVRWALEDEHKGLERYVKDLDFRIDALEEEVRVLRQSLTAVILLTVDDERGITLAEQILREQRQ